MIGMCGIDFFYFGSVAVRFLFKISVFRTSLDDEAVK